MNKFIIYIQLIGFSLLVQVSQLSHIHLPEQEITQDILHQTQSVDHSHDDSDHHHENSNESHHHNHHELHINTDQFYLATSSQQVSKSAPDQVVTKITTSISFHQFNSHKSFFYLGSTPPVEWFRMPRQGRSPPISA